VFYLRYYDDNALRVTDRGDSGGDGACPLVRAASTAGFDANDQRAEAGSGVVDTDLWAESNDEREARTSLTQGPNAGVPPSTSRVLSERRVVVGLERCLP
jgi:hypothetical protein